MDTTKSLNNDMQQKLSIILGKKRLQLLLKSLPDNKDAFLEELIDLAYEKSRQREDKISSLKQDIIDYERMHMCTKSSKCKYKSSVFDKLDISDCMSRMMKAHIIYLGRQRQCKFNTSQDLSIYALKQVSNRSDKEIQKIFNMPEKTYNARSNKLITEYIPYIVNVAKVVASDAFGKVNDTNVLYILRTFLPVVITECMTNDDISNVAESMLQNYNNTKS